MTTNGQHFERLGQFKRSGLGTVEDNKTYTDVKSTLVVRKKCFTHTRLKRQSLLARNSLVEMIRLIVMFAAKAP